MEGLRGAVSAIINLDDCEWEALAALLKPLTLKKNDALLEEGQTCTFIAFVEEGALVYLKPLENGKLITTDFALDGDWVTNNQSRLSGTPSLISIRAISTCRLVMLRHSDLDNLYRQIPKLERLGRLLMEQAFVKIAQHSIELQSLTARENYLLLMKQYPEALHKIPLYHLANYLGIAPKSLSRIRNEILKA